MKHLLVFLFGALALGTAIAIFSQGQSRAAHSAPRLGEDTPFPTLIDQAAGVADSPGSLASPPAEKSEDPVVRRSTTSPVPSPTREPGSGLPAEEIARLQAREFFQRDRASFRKAFVGGWSEGLTGERLLESFDVDESFQPDELALLVEADVATVNARLSALADQYVPILEGAVERVLISGTPDIVSTSEPAGKKYGDEIYRILADVDGQRFVYRVRFQDDSRLKELLQKRRILMDVRQKRICETIRVVTGSVRHHTEE